jgi:hypothetical protein
MRIRSTVKPDIRLSFNDWMKYIKEQVNKTKK